MKDDGDVFGTLGWGLRTYGWIVVACMLGLGVLVPSMLDRLPDQYEAEAQVGPTEALNLPNLDPLPRLGESVFNNGVVAQAVRDSVDPPLPRSVSVVPERVELVAAQDNIVFTIVGHGSTPQSAERVANIAAATYALELNKYAESVGSFAIQRLATPPTSPETQVGGPLAVGVGLLAGLAFGVGLVTLLLVWHRPVLDATGVKHTTGSPVLGRVVFGASRDGVRGLPALCHLVLCPPTEMLLLAGPRNTRPERLLLTAQLNKVIERTERKIAIIDGPSQLDVAARPATSLTLLVVHEGISQSSLQKQAEQYLDGGAAGVVLVHSHRWNPWLRRRQLPRARRPAKQRIPRSWAPRRPASSPQPTTDA
jgi:hypothetical protein